MRILTSVLTVSVLVPLTSLTAQEQPQIEPGSRVRVTAPDLGLEKSVGTCLSLSQGAMAFEPEGLSQLTIASVSMTELEISRGRKSNWRKGALIGGGIGVVPGVIFGATWRLGSCPDNRAACIAVGAATVGIYGALVGLGVGALIKTERWEEVPLDQLRVSLRPQRDGRLGIGLALKF